MQHNMLTAFIHTFFTPVEEYFDRITSLDLVCTDLFGSDLMLAYLTQVDCRRMERLSLGLMLTPDAISRPPFSSSFPQLESLSFY
jgi:hypothetical protein